MRSAAIAIAALSASLFAPGSAVLAQGLPQVGERVRVTSGVYHQLVSTVQAITAESLVVRASGAEIYLAMAQVSLLETRTQKSYGDVGKTVGAGVGAFVGWAVATAVVEGDCVTTEILSGECIWEDLWVPLIGILTGALLLGATGELIGNSVKTDRWQAVPLDNVRVSLVPQRDGRFTLGMSVRF